MALSNGAVVNYDLLAGVDLAVAGVTAGVWTKTFILPKDVTFGFEYKFASSGVVECTMTFEQGNLSHTEAATSTNMVLPASKSTIAVADALVHVLAYAPVVSNYFRVKVAGTGANDASTVLERFLVNTIKNQ